jgi:hypothetical protein
MAKENRSYPKNRNQSTIQICFIYFFINYCVHKGRHKYCIYAFTYPIKTKTKEYRNHFPLKGLKKDQLYQKSSSDVSSFAANFIIETF